MKKGSKKIAEGQSENDSERKTKFSQWFLTFPKTLELSWEEKICKERITQKRKKEMTNERKEGKEKYT